MNIYDEEFCWVCSTPGSYCNCESSDSPWSKSTSQESFCTFNGREEPANFDVDESAFCTMDGNYFLAGPFENPDLEIDDMIQCLEGGSQQPCAASTPKNDYAEKWESPGTMPPPDSSSPVGLDANSSLFSMDPALLMSRREDLRTVDRLLFCCARDNGRSHVKAPSNDRSDSNAPIFPTTTSMGRSPHPPTLKFQTQQVPSAQTNMGASLRVQGHPTDTSESSSSMSAFSAAQGSLDERLCAISKRQVVAEVHDLCVVTASTTIEQTNGFEKPDEIDRVSASGSLVPASRQRAIFSGPTILDLAISTELEPASSHGTENDGPYGISTTTSSETRRDDGVPSKMPSRRVSIVSVSCPAQATMYNHLKRRRSSVDCPPESKKVKLDRTVSHVSCASDSSVQSKYQATEPASLRRARSLRSDVSACSEESTDSLFYPSPLSSLSSRPYPDKDYPPTVPSTPLPNSVDYARSKANPLARTLVVYRRRSLDIPAIPPVPIIAPSPHLTPTVVRCAEDQAIDRLKALLLRERSERERDGLNVHDEKRTERLKAIYATDLSFSRRGSASTSDSSDGCGQWEEESTRSAIESQESQELAPSVKFLPVQHRLANRETWSNAFGIANDFRKEITGWILKKFPKEPVPSRDERRRGIDLYDQLMNSRQTRFHAAQMFHRYFLLPEKIKYWREACKYEHLERESWGPHEDSDYERSIWDLAVACMALGVKLHRDCLPPLGPVFAAEFLDMAPYSMTHETFELAQRDVLYTFQFQLGSCTPQDVLDELWNALPTLRKVTAPIGWAVVQRVTWDKLFESLLESDMLQYPVTLLTAAALADGLTFALASQYRTEAEANICKCKVLAKTPVSECVVDEIEPTSWQIHLFEATQLVDDVILDVKDVLHLSDMELDECRKWLSYVGQE